MTGTNSRPTRRSGADARHDGASNAQNFDVHGGIPAVCLGHAERSHGANERVYLPSVVRTPQVIDLFIRVRRGPSE